MQLKEIGLGNVFLPIITVSPSFTLGGTVIVIKKGFIVFTEKDKET